MYCIDEQHNIFAFYIKCDSVTINLLYLREDFAVNVRPSSPSSVWFADSPSVLSSTVSLSTSLI